MSNPEYLLSLRQPELAQTSEEALAEAYAALRDTPEDRAGTPRFPRLKDLAGSALEREKDRRETAVYAETSPELPAPSTLSEAEKFYQQVPHQSCGHFLEHHLTAQHALTSCMSCGMCTSLCPAALYFEGYSPRSVVDIALSRDEPRIEGFLRSELIWLCAQCGSCKPRCPRGNDVMSLVTALRLLAQLKGFHRSSVRGRQQYAGRHLWGGNFWNRACSVYFRKQQPETHPEFGPRYARYFSELEEQYERLGACPDQPGDFGGRKVGAETLAEIRACLREGGSLVLWDSIERHAAADAEAAGLDLDAYLEKVGSEG